MQRAKPRKSRVPRAAKIIGGLTFLWVFALLSWVAYAQPTVSLSEKPVSVWMFDVGQGDALFIQAPTGEEMLIDGGRNDIVLSKLGSVLAPWDRNLDAVLLTHPDADHATGLVSVLENYDVEHVYETGIRAGTQIDDAFAAAVQEEETEYERIQVGDVITLGEIELQVLSPNEETLEAGDRNDASLVLLLEYGETTMLFMGDAEADVEEQLQRQVPDVDVLKVGHHGSLSSSTWDFLRQTRPEVSLISAGRDNRYGHPHPIVIDRLNQIGSQIFRTDTQKDILIQSWGNEPQVQVHPLPF